MSSISPVVNSVIFLDIDGVITNHSGRQVTEKLTELYPNQIGMYESAQCDTAAVYLFNEQAIKNLESLLKKVQNSAIVVSSNWRTMKSVEQLRKLFQIHTFSHLIFDKTEDMCCEGACDFKSKLFGRAKEIACWLDRYPEIVSFVILDDYDGGLSEGFPNNFVKINSSDLLSEQDVQKAETILLRKKTILPH